MCAKRRFKVDKLIRNKLSANLLANNIVMSERIMDSEEYVSRLKDKILEEAQEIQEAYTPEEIREELADMLELIHSIGVIYNLSFKDIEDARLEKANRVGGFSQRRYCAFVECPAEHAKTEYFLERPEKYPEIEVDDE